MEIIDPHKNKQKWERWKLKGMLLGDISNENRIIILRYLSDMERGKNISGTNKGSRSYVRLNVLRGRMPVIAKFFENEFNANLNKITRDMASEFAFKLNSGELKRKDGKQYERKGDFIKDLKAFWHWYMRVQSRLHYDTRGREGELLSDITEDFSRGKDEEPNFIYFTIEELQKMMNAAKFKYKVFMLFLFDSIVRAPKEAANVRVSDLEQIKNSEVLQLNVRAESSKTFGRKIKLLLCSELLKKYIEVEGLKGDDCLFKISPKEVNQYIKRIGKETIGKEPTMYDFRHSGACYWAPRYQHETALRYRGGWKDSQRLDYYTKFLGMKDTITKEDLDDADTKTDLQKKLENEEKERMILLDEMKQQRDEFDRKIAKLEKVYKFLEDERITKEAKERMKDKIEEDVLEEQMNRDIVVMMMGEGRG